MTCGNGPFGSLPLDETIGRVESAPAGLTQEEAWADDLETGRACLAPLERKFHHLKEVIENDR